MKVKVQFEADYNEDYNEVMSVMNAREMQLAICDALCDISRRKKNDISDSERLFLECLENTLSIESFDLWG